MDTVNLPPWKLTSRATFCRALARAFWVVILVGSMSRGIQAKAVLLVIQNSSIGSSESSRKSQFEFWGYTVATIQDSSTQSSFNAAVAIADVVYVPGSIDDSQLLYKLRTATAGVVTETPGLDTEFGYATSDGSTQSHSQIFNVDNSHQVTSGVSSGTVTIYNSSSTVAANGNTLAAGMQLLGERSSEQLGLGVIETGGTLASTYSGNNSAAGRRVRLPWAGVFNISVLNSNGLSILKNSLAWASGESLLARWELDETSGTIAADSSFYARDGVVSGTATWVAGRRENALDLDKSTRVTAPGLIGNPVDFTIACWAKTRSTDSSGSELVSVGDHFEILSHYTPYNSPVAAFHDGSDYVVVGASGGSRIGTGWHHYVVTFDDTLNTMKIYVDGVLAGTTITTSSVVYTGQGSDTIIGANGEGNGYFDHDGPIDDVQIYSIALTADEIADLYDLRGHWRLDESSGITAADSSPQGNDGIYTDGPVLGTEGDQVFSHNRTCC